MGASQISLEQAEITIHPKQCLIWEGVIFPNKKSCLKFESQKKHENKASTFFRPFCNSIQTWIMAKIHSLIDVNQNGNRK